MIPEKIIEIESFTFYGCRSLVSIELPKNLKRIQGEAFLECTSLVSIVIPENTIEIGVGAFMECISLTSIELPEKIEKMGDGIFRNCTSLSSIIIRAVNPPILFREGNLEQDNTEMNLDLNRGNTNCTIYVPKQSVKSYKKNKEWGNYDIQPIRENIDEDNNDSEQDDYKAFEDDEGASHWDNDRDYDYYDNYDWLAEAAGTDDPEVMNDVYWNLD